MTNNVKDDEQWFDDLYKDSGTERSPAELDALILQAASQNQRRRWPVLATAAVLVVAAGVLINVPDSALSPASQSEIASTSAQSGTLPAAKTTPAEAANPLDRERPLKPSMELPTQAASDSSSVDSLADGALDSDSSREEAQRDEIALAAELQPHTATPADENSNGLYESGVAANAPMPSSLGRAEERADQVYSGVAPEPSMAMPSLRMELETPPAPVAAQATTPGALAPESPAKETPPQETPERETGTNGFASGLKAPDHAVEEVIVTGAMKRTTGAGTTASIRGCPVLTFYLNSSEESLIELRQCSDGRWTLDPERKLCKRYLRVKPSELRVDGETLTWADGQAIACEDGRFNRPTPAETR